MFINYFILITFVINIYNIYQAEALLQDKYGRIKMGVVDDKCDDAKTSLETDWDGSPVNYTCSHPDSLIPVPTYMDSEEECENVPDTYFPQHFCMKDKIVYNHILPTHGDHRPLWPKFGEYKFVPAQRWSHNVEHGSIVMLYHPCADQNQVAILRELVVNCIRKHIITAYNLLPEDRPLALVGWGCRLLFNKVDNKTITSFIRKRALHGPEGHLPKEGQYDYLLLNLAKPPRGSDLNDANICPGADDTYKE